MLATEVAGKRMNVTEARKKAKALGIIPGKTRKAELTHSIQIEEGCTPCFGKSNGQCAHTDCYFIQ